MYSLLVLGIIPGTDIQISFQAWLLSAALVGVSTYRRRHQLRLALQIAGTHSHQRPHARVLHTRGV